uniref:Uncharacterized protein n=1 Tax=Arundo donax TaxID=35708 RepID=A0A0A9F8M0_ARUDO
MHASEQQQGMEGGRREMRRREVWEEF